MIMNNAVCKGTNEQKSSVCKGKNEQKSSVYKNTNARNISVYKDTIVQQANRSAGRISSPIRDATVLNIAV